MLHHATVDLLPIMLFLSLSSAAAATDQVHFTLIFSTHRALPAVYAQYQQPAAAYVTHNGMLIPAQAAQQTTPLIDYTGAYVAQLTGGAFAATDVAAAAGSGKFMFVILRRQLKLTHASYCFCA